MRIATGLLFLAVVASGARAQVVYSNFGPGDTFFSNLFYTNTITPILYTEIGFGFTPSMTGELTQLRTPLMRAGGAGNMVISLYRDTGTLPGDLLADWTALPPWGVMPTIWTLPLSGPVVEAGQTYFLSVRAEQTTSPDWRWFATTPLTQGECIFQNASGPWQNDISSMPAFELSIPAPSGSMIAGMAFAAMAAFRRRTTT